MVKFRCPCCGQRIAVDDKGIGAFISCPTCADGIVVPAETAMEFQVLVRPPVIAGHASDPDHPDPQTLLQYQHRLRTYEERIAQLEQQLAAKEAANSQLMRDLLVLSAQSIEAEAADADAAARLAEPGLLLRT